MQGYTGTVWLGLYIMNGSLAGIAIKQVCDV